MGELDGRYPHGFARQKGYGTAFHRQAVAEWQFDEIDHFDSLVGLDVGRFEAMVLYFHHKDIAPVALSVLEGFVQNGGGVLAIHSATASFTEQARYFEILGGRFSGHGPVEAFDIRPASAENEVWGGIEPFTVEDELYLHDLQPDIQVHFTAQYDGEAQPMVWTRTLGNGRVCYVCPGHHAETMKQPEMEEILKRGLKWVCGAD